MQQVSGRYVRQVMVTVVGLATVLAPLLLAGQAQERQVGGVGIAVFSDSNYRGRNASFRTDTPDLRPYELDDRISSLRVAPGEIWEVCERANYGGRCQVFSGPEPDLDRTGWSDTISSLRRVPDGSGGGGGYPPIQPRGGLELFSRTRFQGDRRLITDAVSDLRRLGFNDDARSLRLDPSQSWEICADSNFRTCRVVDSDWPDLEGIEMSERISSVRPWGQGGGGVRPPFPGEVGRIVLFDERQYRGRSFNVDAPMPILSGFNQRAESVQVFGGVWELCDDAQFRGRCVTVSSNIPDLAALGLRNRVESVRPQ
jgi:hypothetical protein